MYLIKPIFKRLYLIVIITYFLFLGCDRSEQNFFEIEPFPTSEEFFKPSDSDDVLVFKQINRLDSTEPPKIIQWAWGLDTSIDNYNIKRLLISNSNLNILLPSAIFIYVDFFEVRRFIDGYSYPFFRRSKFYQWDTIRSEIKGVKPHYYLYWWKHHIDTIKGQNPPQYRAYCGIDSIWFGDEIGKTVNFELTSGLGITQVDMIEINIPDDFDTLRHYTLERIY